MFYSYFYAKCIAATSPTLPPSPREENPRDDEDYWSQQAKEIKDYKKVPVNTALLDEASKTEEEQVRRTPDGQEVENIEVTPDIGCVEEDNEMDCSEEKET